LQTLKKAAGLTTTDITSHKLTQLDDKTVAELEELLSDWINTVENNITDDTAARFVKLMISALLACCWSRESSCIFLTASFVIFEVLRSK
jgi:hypothetical protein